MGSLRMIKDKAISKECNIYGIKHKDFNLINPYCLDEKKEFKFNFTCNHKESSDEESSDEFFDYFPQKFIEYIISTCKLTHLI